VNAAWQQSMHRLLLFAIILIAGCAHNTGVNSTFNPQKTSWEGRLSLRVNSAQRQVLHAHFDLQGSPQMGTLRLATPLGTTLADMQWSANAATLQTGGKTQHFDSLPALVRHVTGTDLPITNLFAWLQGIALPAANWQVDLTEMASGRISAQRIATDSPADLKIILDP